MTTVTSAEPAQAELRHDRNAARYGDALDLIEMLHQRVHEVIKKDAPDSGGHGRFCTVFNCMDGRCQRLVHTWCEREFRVEYADTITIAGCDKVLLDNEAERERAMQMAKISIDKHGAQFAVVVGHSSCAGNPVSDEEHLIHVQQSVAMIAERGLFQGVVGPFVDVANKRVDFVCRSGTTNPAHVAAA
jgi:hypothetical protein